MTETEMFSDLPAELVRLLERELLPIDIDTFWDRADAIRKVLPRKGRLPEDIETRRTTMRAMVSDDLAEAVLAVAARPDTGETAVLRTLLRHWENMRLDEEKMLGHLLLTHGRNLDSLAGMDEDATAELHAALHLEPSFAADASDGQG